MIRLIDILLEDVLTERTALSKVKDFLTGKNVAPRTPGEPIQIGRKRRPTPEVSPIRKRGDVWQTKSGKFGAKNGNGETRYYTTREAAETYSKGPQNKRKTTTTTSKNTARRRITTRSK
jgi:hypothetical protein